jgi:glycosyltransferase involved in cell wall biosynthesis
MTPCVRGVTVMHIAIDLRMVGRQLHGIARYALELSRRLPALAPDSRFDLLVGDEFDATILGPALPNVRLVPARSRFLSPAEQVELPLLLRRLAPDLYHSPSFSVPTAYRGALALTIHDANHLAFPEHYGKFHGHYYRHIVRPGALRSRLLLTVSQFARGELERRLGLAAGHVRVVYNGVDPAFRRPPQAAIAAFRQKHRLPERFVLYVGNTKPHKNVEQLVDSFRLLPSSLSLVLCAGPRTEALMRRAEGSASRIRLLDSVADVDLALLYSSAEVFAFPSLYEGFGLPPLEAMACETPVVATRATALPEVLGEAATLVEPGDVRGFAEALSRVASDPAHASRLREAGRERAAQFSWDEAAKSVLAAYRVAADRQVARVPVRVAASGAPGPRGPALKVLFCVRHNLWSLPGGDATQILRTRAALQERGAEVTLWTEPKPPPTGSFDLAHLFHLTRLDTYVHAEALARAGMPFVLSTIYWPTAEFERRGYVGALRLLHAALSEGPADVAKNGVRAVLADGDWRWALLPGAFLPLEQRIERLIEKSLCLLPNSDAEGEVLRSFGATRIRPIVNAADPPPRGTLAPEEPLPEGFVMCAGRIEPRKNQLALIQAMEGQDVPLLIVGDPGPMHGDYFRRVQAAAGKNVKLLPARSREQLFALYARAEAHVAPAWYETPGLVSLEAAAAGSRVVTTDRGSTREYFGSDAFYLDPGSAESIRGAVLAALGSPRTPALRERVRRDFTWERAGEQTLAAYRDVLGGTIATQGLHAAL